jgi:hypothetical protein
VRRLLSARGEARQFSVAPLLAFIGAESNLAAAAALGIANKQLYRFTHHGLTPTQADVLAVRLGHHPSAIWPDWFEGVGVLDCDDRGGVPA